MTIYHNLAWVQFELSVARIQGEEKAVQDIRVKDDKRYITVDTPDKQYIFDKACGTLVSLKKNGEELLQRPTDFVLWRAMLRIGV